MKKIFYLTITLLLCIFVISCAGCERKLNLFDSVSELRENVYEGQSANFVVKAAYGFKENSPKSDGNVSERIYKLTFKLPGKQTDGITYTVKFTHNGEDFGGVFAFNPVTDALTAVVEIENFNLPEFTVTLTAGGKNEEITMKSLLPEGTISIHAALNALKEKQADLIKTYCDENGIFSAEIYARVIVKNQKPYWYIGLDKGSNDLKALLIDGFTGEVLAIRDIF